MLESSSSFDATTTTTTTTTTTPQAVKIHTLPFVIPIAQMGLLGSIYCTVALALERFLAVCHPFLPRR
jgi:hypothetical protein